MTSAQPAESDSVRSAVQVRRLTVERGRRRVLPGVSCDLPTGMITGLLGPSGCGKTTFLRCIVGSQRVTSGTVHVFGLPAGHAELRRRIGYVTQAPAVYSDLSVRDNARYFATLYGLDSNVADTAVRDVGLADHASALAGNLSGGQRARASLACALLASPDLLVLDEPTVGLDPVLRHDLWQRFHALAERGTTLIISSHVMDEAGRCDRLLLMRDGVFIADDSPDALREATGLDDLEQVFLQLIARAGATKAEA